MRTSLRFSSASRLDTSSTASRAKAVPAMKAIFWATASCWPTGRPHCTRSVPHSRAILREYLAVPAQMAGRDRADVDLREQEGADVRLRHQGEELPLLLLGAEQPQRLGDADGLMGGQQGGDRGVPRPGQGEGTVVVHLVEADAAVLLGNLE